MVASHETNRLRTENSRAVNLRAKVSTVVDSSLQEDQARMFVRCNDRRKLEIFVEHAVGSICVPMSDAALEVKFRDLTNGHLHRAQSESLMELCWEVEKLEDISELSQLSSPIY